VRICNKAVNPLDIVVCAAKFYLFAFKAKDIYPAYLNPAYSEELMLDGKPIEIPKSIIRFQKWNGPAFKESLGGKAIVSKDANPMFAEIAIMSHFVNSGWEARWLQIYGRGNKVIKSHCIFRSGKTIAIQTKYLSR
jgi:hypothetical protein